MSKLTWAIVVDENAYTESVPGKTGYRLGLNALPSDKKLFKDINPFVFIYYTPDEKSGQDESYLSLSGSEVSSLEYDKKAQKLDIELIDYDAGFLIETETFEVGVPTATKWIRQTNNHADYFEFTPTHIFVGTEMNHDSMKPFKEWLESFMDKHKYNPSTEGFPKTAETNFMKAEIDEVDNEVAIIRNQLGDSVGNIELEDRDVEDVSIEIYNDDGVLLEEIVLGSETFGAEGDSWDGTTGDDFRKYDDMELTEEDHEILVEEIGRGFENYPADTLRNAKASAVSQINWFGIDKSLGEYDAENFEASGSGSFNETGGRMVTIDSDIEVNYDWQTDPYEIEDEYGEIQEKVEEKVRDEYYQDDSGSGYMREEYLDENNEYQDYEISYDWNKEVTDGEEEEIKSWAETDLSMNAEIFEAFKYGENNKYWKMRKNAYLRNNKYINRYEEKDWEKIFKNGIAPQNDEEMVEWIKNRQLTDDNLKYGMSRANTLSRINAVLRSYFDERMYFRPYGAETFDAKAKWAGFCPFCKKWRTDEMSKEMKGEIVCGKKIASPNSYGGDMEAFNRENFERKGGKWLRSNSICSVVLEEKPTYYNAEEFDAEHYNKYFDELEVLHGRQNHFTYNNLGSMAYNSLYMAARELGATPIEAFNLCNSKWVRHNEDYIPNNMTEMFMNMMYRQGDNWKHYIEGHGEEFQIEDYSRNTLWRGMQQTGGMQLQINKQYGEAGIEGYDAETDEDSWEKGVIRLAISSGCFSDEYAEWVERQIDGPSATLNNPRYKEIIDKRWGLGAETEVFNANAKTGNKVYIITRRCEDYSAYRELDMAVFGSKTEAKKKFNFLFKEEKEQNYPDETIADAKAYMRWGDVGWGIETFMADDMLYELREQTIGNNAMSGFYFDAEGDYQ